MKIKKIAEILIQKLSSKELHDFLTICDEDENVFDDLLAPLFERDKKNYPESYLPFGLARK